MSINQNEPKKLVYTVKEISHMLGISLRSAYNLCGATTDFKIVKLGEKSIRVNKESFDNWFSGL
jgi:predicted DNA-binding transcriptional regulator AlpA